MIGLSWYKVYQIIGVIVGVGLFCYGVFGLSQRAEKLMCRINQCNPSLVPVVDIENPQSVGLVPLK